MNTKFTFPGLKEVLLARRSSAGPVDMTTIRALFRLPDTAVTGRRRSLVDFLAQVPLFEDLGRRDRERLARIVHERDYGDGEYICEEGRPGAALFVLRQGLVDVVKRGTDGREMPVAVLEPPASFEEWAAVGIEGVRWFSVRARGPVSLLALGKSDLDAMMQNFPVLASRVLMKLAGITSIRLQILLDAQDLRRSAEHEGQGS